MTRTSAPARWLMLWTGLAAGLLFLLIGLNLCCFGGSVGEWLKPERVLAFFGFIAGALVVTWQLERQHRNTLNAQAQSARHALNLAIYRDLADVARVAADSSRAMISAVMAIQLDVHTRRTIYRATQQTPAPEQTHHDFLQSVQKANSDLLEIPAVIEKWEIALDPEVQRRLRLSLFQHIDEMRAKAFDFGHSVAGWIQDPNVPLVGWPPSNEVLEAMTQLGAAVQEAVFDIVADLYDLRVETQNALLGELFSRHVVARALGEPIGRAFTVDSNGKLREGGPS